MKIKSAFMLSLLLLCSVISRAKCTDTIAKPKHGGIEAGIAPGFLFPCNPGHAGSGNESTLNLAYRFSNYFGIGMEASAFENRPTTNYVNNTLGPAFEIPDGTIVANGITTNGDADWKGSYYMAGLRFYYPAGKFLFISDCNVGELFITAPVVSSSVTFVNNGSYEVKNTQISSNNANAVCFKFSISTEYNLNRRFALTARIFYLFANPEVVQTAQTYFISGNAQSQTSQQLNYLQPISNVGCSLGVVVKL